MNLKEITLMTALLLNPGTIDAIKTTTKGELIENTKEVSKSKDILDYHQVDISTNILDSIKSLETIDSIPTIISRSTKDLNQTPLFMSGIKRHIGEFLGYNQYQNILRNYNQGNEKKLHIQELETIKFPLIYDDFRATVSSNLQERLQDEKLLQYSEQLANKSEMVIIDKDEHKNSFISYYVDNKLIVCTYISTGRYSQKEKAIETPTGIYTIGAKVSHRRSQAHDNAPMAYALHIIRGVYQHQGYADGKRRSHGCIRVPGLYQEFLFYHIKTGTPIVIL